MALFRKKASQPKNSELFLSFVLSDGTVIWKGKLYDLPVKETFVLKRSVELFQDPAPCYIHRGAVMMRFYGELEAFLQENQHVPLLGEQWPDWLQESLDLPYPDAEEGFPTLISEQ